MKRLFFVGSVMLLLCVCNSCTKKQYSVWGDVSGMITDAYDGTPLSGATVTLTPGGKNTLTGSDGYFEFLDLDAQQYTLQVTKHGYQTNRKIVNAVVGENTFITIPLTPQQ